MGREQLIKAIMARDGVSRQEASNKVGEIYNSDRGQEQVNMYQEFSQQNPSLIEAIETSYVEPSNTMQPDNFGQQRPIISSLPEMQMQVGNQGGYDPFSGSSQVGETLDPLNNSSSQGYMEPLNNPLNVDRLQARGPSSSLSNDIIRSEAINRNQKINPNTPEAMQGVTGMQFSEDGIQDAKNAIGEYNQETEKRREQSTGMRQGQIPLFYPGETSIGYKAHTAGRLLGKSNKSAGDWIGGLGAAASGALSIGRGVMSGIAQTRQNEKAQQWWRDKEQERQYTPNREYQDRNTRGGTPYKKGGIVRIKRNG